MLHYQESRLGMSLLTLTVYGHRRHRRRRRHRVEHHPADPVHADCRHAGLQRRIHRVRCARNRQPVGDTVRFDDAAHGGGAAAGQAE